jgi:hypothetical protein
MGAVFLKLIFQNNNHIRIVCFYYLARYFVRVVEKFILISHVVFREMIKIMRNFSQDTRPQGRESWNSKLTNTNFLACWNCWYVFRRTWLFYGIGHEIIIWPWTCSSWIAYVTSVSCRTASQLTQSIHAFVLLQRKYSVNTVFHFEADQTLRSKYQIQIMTNT